MSLDDVALRWSERAVNGHEAAVTINDADVRNDSGEEGTRGARVVARPCDQRSGEEATVDREVDGVRITGGGSAGECEGARIVQQKATGDVDGLE